MDAKHTPGPWSVQPHQRSHGKQEVIVGPDNVTILALMECGQPFDKSNARLIAAAPVLLAVAERVLPYIIGLEVNFEGNKTIVANDVRRTGVLLRAAISKAKGGQS